MFTRDPTSKTKDHNFGTFEKHTKGIGLKLLQKMGFKQGEGLGPAHQGITAPIEVKVRPKGRALQNEDERTKQSKQQFSVDDPDVEEQKFHQQLQQWRVEPGQRRRKPKYSYKTPEALAEELAIKTADVAPSAVKVVDMTGPKTRVLSGYDQLAETRGAHLPVLSSADGSVPMPELQHNLNQLIEMAASDIQRIGNRLRRERDVLTGVAHDRAELTERLAREAKSISNLKEIIAVIRACVGNPNLSLKQCAESFELLRNSYPDEYRMYGLSALAPALAFPLMKKVTHSFDVQNQLFLPLAWILTRRCLPDGGR